MSAGMTVKGPPLRGYVTLLCEPDGRVYRALLPGLEKPALKERCTLPEPLPNIFAKGAR